MRGLTVYKTHMNTNMLFLWFSDLAYPKTYNHIYFNKKYYFERKHIITTFLYLRHLVWGIYLWGQQDRPHIIEQKDDCQVLNVYNKVLSKITVGL